MFSGLRWVVLVCCFAGSALAQSPSNNSGKAAAPKPPTTAPTTVKTPPKEVPKAQPAPAKEMPKPAVPDQFKLNMLVRTTIIAVNQANKTGNYTVLRDLASPRFREANSPEQLAAIFEGLRKAKFDLSPVLFFTPKLIRPPAIEKSGMLGLTGFFDTRPQQVAFDFLFESVEGDWQLYGINIATQPAPAAGSAAAPSPPASSGQEKQ